MIQIPYFEFFFALLKFSIFSKKNASDHLPRLLGTTDPRLTPQKKHEPQESSQIFTHTHTHPEVEQQRGYSPEKNGGGDTWKTTIPAFRDYASLAWNPFAVDGSMGKTGKPLTLPRSRCSFNVHPRCHISHVIGGENAVIRLNDATGELIRWINHLRWRIWTGGDCGWEIGSCHVQLCPKNHGCNPAILEGGWRGDVFAGVGIWISSLHQWLEIQWLLGCINSPTSFTGLVLATPPRYEPSNGWLLRYFKGAFWTAWCPITIPWPHWLGPFERREEWLSHLRQLLITTIVLVRVLFPWKSKDYVLIPASSKGFCLDPRDGVWAPLIIHDRHPLEDLGMFWMIFFP